MTNQNPIKVIGKLSKLASENARFILFNFGRNRNNFKEYENPINCAANG